MSEPCEKGFTHEQIPTLHKSGFARSPRLTGVTARERESNVVDEGEVARCGRLHLSPRQVVSDALRGCKMLWICGANRAKNSFSFKGEKQHGRYYC